MGREDEMGCEVLWEMLNYSKLKARRYGGVVAPA